MKPFVRGLGAEMSRTLGLGQWAVQAEAETQQHWMHRKFYGKFQKDGKLCKVVAAFISLGESIGNNTEIPCIVWVLASLVPAVVCSPVIEADCNPSTLFS
ncbi:hypothetical protein D5086_007560 [Populus alba]|uniref:Uncharacterized protein n=1 Tax=Populus alba TaxID=43335 RepID=A0ACC4CNW0_POPAL